MRTAILEILNNTILACPTDVAWQTELRGTEAAAGQIHQLICDSMATAMYRCLDHMPREKQGLAKTRLAEYGFSKEEIEKSISKLKNEINDRKTNINQTC